MRVHFCGVRGSTPATGASYIRYGGSTSCLAVAHDDDVRPSLILDGGTGIRGATALLGGEPFLGAILLTHLHWDHYQGLPFFGGADREDAHIDLFVPDQGDGSSAEDVLAKGMSPPQFPIRPSEMSGDWRFESVSSGRIELEKFEIEVREVPHKGGTTFGYRVTDGRSSLTYIPDHCPTLLGPGPDGWGEYHEGALELAADSDLVVHDSHLLPEELEHDAYLGHSVPDYAIELARRADARAVMLFHHRPDRSDDALDAIARRYELANEHVTVAVEGTMLDL